ncbi:MAG: Rpp14/Pop5 family protein [Acidilobaceae archaeon]
MDPLSLALSALLGFLGGVIGGYAVRRVGIPSPLLLSPKKERRRYVVFEAVTAERLTKEEVNKAFVGAMRELYGELGLIASRARLVEYDEERRRGAVRVRRAFRDHVLGALGYVKEVGGKRARLVPIATTGSVRRARRLIS